MPNSKGVTMINQYFKIIIMISVISLLSSQNTISGYKVESVGHLSISQTQVDNWEAGGESTLSWQTNLKSSFSKKHPIWNELHILDMSFGKTRVGDIPARKSIDEIKLESLINLKIRHGVNPYLAINLQSQFSPGYNYNENSSELVSDFLDPLYITESTGFAWEIFNSMNSRLGFAMKQTFTDQFPAPYADDPTTLEIEKSKFEYGLEWVVDYQNNINELTSINSKIELFSDLVSVRQTDVRWDSNFSTKLSDLFDVSFNFKLIYDQDISNRRQIRQYLAIGISYTLR